MEYVLKPYAGDLRHQYVDYLVKRLTDWRKAGVRFGQKFNGQHTVAITANILQGQLGGSLYAPERFEEVCAFIKAKIDATILGQRNQRRGVRSYHAFGEIPTTPVTKGGHYGANAICGGTDDCGLNQPHAEIESSPASAPDAGAGAQHYVGGNDEPLSERQQLEAGARRVMLVSAEPFLKSGLSVRETARVIGVQQMTLHRTLQLAALQGAERITSAEKCRRLLEGPIANLAPGSGGGKESAFKALLAVPEIGAEMHRLYVATMGASCAQATVDRRTGSLATVLLRLGDCPLVPPHLAEKLRAGSQPKCLVDFIKQHWTPEMEAKFRGQKHYGTATVCGRRDLTEELADGSIVPLQPGRVWVFDDMSSNIPFWFEVASDTADACGSDRGLQKLIERHGCCIGRQGLYAWDWASGAWLGLELVGRMRDAYQASDILRFIRKLVQMYGKPDKIIMEGGVWRARAITGWGLRAATEDIGDESLVESESGRQIPEMAADEAAKIQDGLRAIGVEIIHTHTPRGKPIEGAFNYHQRLVPTFFGRGEVVNIGRHAGEFEWSAAQHRRASQGVLHPR